MQTTKLNSFCQSFGSNLLNVNWMASSVHIKDKSKKNEKYLEHETHLGLEFPCKILILDDSFSLEVPCPFLISLMQISYE